MIRIKLTSIAVDDQDKAEAFYVDKLGFQRKRNIPMGPVRYLTVVSPAEPDGVMEQTDYDPRPGGSFAIFERRGADLARHFGRFVEIERPERLVFDFWVDEAPEEPTRVTVRFEPDGEGSRATLSHELAPAWASYAERTTAGWTLILDGLERRLESGQASR